MVFTKRKTILAKMGGNSQIKKRGGVNILLKPGSKDGLLMTEQIMLKRRAPEEGETSQTGLEETGGVKKTKLKPAVYEASQLELLASGGPGEHNHKKKGGGEDCTYVKKKQKKTVESVKGKFE